MMKRLISAIVPLVMALFVAGCMGSDGEVTKSATPGPLATYTIKSVDVAFAENAKVNDMVRFDNPDDKKVAADIKANVEAVLRSEMNTHFRGKTPATLKVRIQNADVRTGAGHIVGTSSFLTSEVSIIDAASGTEIRKGFITTEYRGMRGSGNIGMLVMVAANAGTTLEKRYRQLAERFANDVAVWAK